MACKYIYKDTTYTKEEFESFVKEEFVKKSPENKFLSLLEKDSNWVTFFIKSIISDSAKKGYEKVLFPTGNTAGKVEGHTTLEEFKKQKEDRIKQLEKEKNEIKYKNNIINLGQTNEFKEYQEKNKILYDKYTEEKNYEEIAKLTDKFIGKKNNFKTEITNEPINDSEKRKLNNITQELQQLKQELERIETEGFGALRPIYNFYENTVTNILKKQGYNPILITDEYGNTWNEVTVNQFRDLSNILLQRNEANQIIGQANIKAMSVLIDAINQKQDTLPHEYAHHYIAWFRNTPIVQEGIKRFGSEEALVQSIGEQVVKQKGEAYNWWKKFTNFILRLLSDKQLLQVLTDSFLNRTDLSSDFTYNQITPQQKQQATFMFSEFLSNFVDSKVEEIDNSLYISILNQLEQENKIEKDCSDGGKLKAEKGLATSFVKGTDWKIVKDFKGQPKHSQGGVDITISDKGVSMRRGGKDIKAKYGLLIINNN